MNNSEPPVVASSVNVLAASQTCVYTPSWDNSSRKPGQNGPPVQNRSNSSGTIVVECSEATLADGVQDTQVVEIERADHGFWLLFGSAAQDRQWKRLQGTPKGAVMPLDLCLSRPTSRIKRSCDVIGSLFLLVVLSPLFILIAILIKLDSVGPVFFRHYRIGKGGKRFVLWKFRSMRTDVPEYEESPRSVGDNRLTRVGRLIRRLSIDEMPQLINVLKGEMSLVGPRPEMPFIVARYPPAACERVAVTPGITGLWQISPARAFPIHENLQYDLYYIHNQNCLLDCAIILRTVSAVIHGVGAV
jgi:lipopolysaccharide/colanic/teichoic acid biosynthesis glycosyltransferase